MPKSSTLISVPVNVLLEKAAQLQSLADTNEDVFDRINRSLEALDGNGDWHSVSQGAAAAATRANKEKYKEAVEEMRKLAAFLQSFADDMAAADERIKKQIQSV